MAHFTLPGLQYCVTLVMRLNGIHHRMHWTTPYVFTRSARWSCRDVSQRLLGLVAAKLGTGAETIAALDDTLVKKSGTHFFGRGNYPAA